jgi:hypothetical protein
LHTRTTEHQPHTALGDDGCGIMVSMACVIAALAADPGKQCLGLRGGWITTESVADLHTGIMYSIALRSKYGKYQPIDFTCSI